MWVFASPYSYNKKNVIIIIIVILIVLFYLYIFLLCQTHTSNYLTNFSVELQQVNLSDKTTVKYILK